MTLGELDHHTLHGVSGLLFSKNPYTNTGLYVTTSEINKEELKILSGQNQENTKLLENDIDFNVFSAEIADPLKLKLKEGLLETGDKVANDDKLSEYNCIVPTTEAYLPALKTCPSTSGDSKSSCDARSNESSQHMNEPAENWEAQPQRTGKRSHPSGGNDGSGGGDSHNDGRERKMKAPCQTSDEDSSYQDSSLDGMNSQMQSCFSPRTRPTQQQLNDIFVRYVLDDFEEGDQKRIRQLQGKIQHAFYCRGSGHCQDPVCKAEQVKQWVQKQANDYETQLRSGNIQPTKALQMFMAAIMLHAIHCQLSDCQVALCCQFKERIPKQTFGNDVGKVIYSNTSVFTYGQKVAYGTDYWFVCDRPLARGAFGSVSEVWFNKNDVEAKLAVKRVVGTDDFRSDAEFAGLLNGHPNILAPQAVIQMGLKDGYTFYELGLCSLHDYCKSFFLRYNSPQLPLSLAVNFMRQITMAIIHMHEKGLLHRDIKPMNVILMNSFQPMIADFDGVIETKKAATQSMEERVLKGTGGFTAPELYLHTPDSYATESSDVYSLYKTFADMIFERQFIKCNSRDQYYQETLTCTNNMLQKCNPGDTLVLMQAGLNLDRDKRPTALNFLKILQNFQPCKRVPSIHVDNKQQKYCGVVDTMFQQSGIHRAMERLDKNLPARDTPHSARQLMHDSGIVISDIDMAGSQ